MTFGDLKRLLLLQARSDAPDVVVSSGLWLNLAQRRICRDQPPGGWWFTEYSETLAADSSGNVTLSFIPLQVRDVIAGTTRLQKIRSEQSILFSALTSTVAYYTSAKQILTAPPLVAGALLRIVYDRILPDLSADSDTNDLVEAAPDALVFAAMSDVSLHLGRTDIQLWEARYARALEELRVLNLRRRGVFVGDVRSDAAPRSTEG